MLGKLPETALMHRVAALQVNRRGLACKKVVFLADWTRVIQRLFHVPVLLQ